MNEEKCCYSSLARLLPNLNLVVTFFLLVICSNILMADQRETLKIGDFGAARQGNQTLNHYETAVGAFGYEAPDISLNTTYTTKIDVW